MDNQILSKIDFVLNSRKTVWYADKNVEFVNKSYYVDFDEQLNRELYIADYTAEEKLLICTCIFTNNEYMFTIGKQYINSAGQSFFDYLAVNRICGIDNLTNNSGYIMINGVKADTKFIYSNQSIETAIVKYEPLSIQLWLKNEILQFFENSINIRINFESKRNIDNETITISVFIPISNVEVELSTDTDNDIIRWKEVTLDSKCLDYCEISKDEALVILKENGIILPSNSEPTGWYRNEFGGNTNAYIFRCEHKIPDELFSNYNNLQKDLNTKVPYRNFGYITVENDFFQCMIDTKNRKVTSLHQKWQKDTIIKEIINQAN